MRNMTSYQARQIDALSSKELTFLRLSMHNMTPIEISNFLEISLERLIGFRKSVMLKLGCTTWNETVLKAFNLGVLKKEDYTSVIIKELAQNYAKDISDSYCINKSLDANSFELLNFLEKKIIEFYNKCDEGLFLENKADFSTREKRMLKLKFKGENNAAIEKQLNLKKADVIDVNYNIFLKLKVEDWFNSFKKAFQFRLIDKAEFKTLNLELEALKLAEQIMHIMVNNKLIFKEKELVIYSELIAFYNKIEYDYLLKLDLGKAG